MKYWVRVKFDYSGNPTNNHLQEIKTNHYYRECDDIILHVNRNSCINILHGFNSSYVNKEITQEEFENVLKETIDTMGINITNHKFITNGKK